GVVVAGLDLGASSVTVRTLASGVGFGGMIAGALVLGQSRWRFGSRWLFAALGLTLWFFSPVFAASASSAVVVAVGELTIGVLLSALTPVILDHVSIAQLEADHASRQVVTAGLLVGDSRAFASAQTRKRYFRRVHLPIPKGWWGRILWVDWLSVIRSPIRLAGAGAVGVATGLVVSSTGGDVLVIAVALVVLQRVFRVFAQGLSDYLDTIGADGITPDLFWGRVFRHSTLPWVGYIFFLCLGFVTAILTLPDVALDPWVCAVVLCVPPCVTVMLAGESGVPVSMLTPVATPLGDASILVLVGWMVRGFIPAGLFLVVGTIAGGLAATVMLIPVTVVSALLRLPRLAGI
ncbi:MAG TPA: hypothetical protein VK054_14095, partial [Beutenbergiaceae bacterium]|nr:hypothetical protein [Beutenbergiaceae bacterium]